MPRPSNTAERRTQIARALLTVMARSGYDGAAIVDVAREAGLAPGLVHYHFESKLAILLAAIDLLAADYAARLDRHIARAAGDPEAELAAFIDAHLRAGKEADPNIVACFVVILGEALREPSVREAYARVTRDAIARLTGILRRGARRGCFTVAEPDAASAAIFATIQGYFVLAAATREIIPRGSAADSALVMARSLVAKAKRTPTEKSRKERSRS